MPAQVIYDIETYPNFFSLAAVSFDRDDLTIWEYSTRRNDLPSLIEWLFFLRDSGAEMIGFNNINFDYVVLHDILSDPSAVTLDRIYQKAMQVINSTDKFGLTVWESERIIPQIDLFKIHHFDNVARATSLKALQFNMRAASVEDLPIPPGTVMTPEQMDTTRAYNAHDVLETRRFAQLSREAIEMRRKLRDTGMLRGDVLNFNDTKVGKQYFAQQLGDDLCYRRDGNGKRQPRQTYRSEIRLGDIIFPYIRFQHPEFIRVWSWLMDQTITETKGVFDNVHATINGFRFDFGTGGIHGSIERTAVRSDDAFRIIDVDVTSLYPSIAIVNGLYPAHLGQQFVQVYSEMKQRRVGYKKGTPENAMLKLALNGVYGDSNNQYSVFYDPKYTMSVTINGQLLLCILAEWLLSVPALEIIQINTDGVTVKCPRAFEWMFDSVCKQWEQYTCLDLERVDYSAMFIRDVNNYLAVYEDGVKTKAKGAYNYPTKWEDYAGWWHRDYSALVVPQAVEAQLVHGQPVEDFIARHDNPFDFMLRAKAPRGSTLYIGDQEAQRTLRYYIAQDGAPLVKQMPPSGPVGAYKRKNGISDTDYHAVLREIEPGAWDARIHTANKSKYEPRRSNIQAGWLVAECNKAADFDWNRLDRRWYVEEARKLLI